VGEVKYVFRLKISRLDSLKKLFNNLILTFSEIFISKVKIFSSKMA